MQTATVYPSSPVTESESRVSSERRPGLWQPIALTVAGLIAGLALIAVGLAIA